MLKNLQETLTVISRSFLIIVFFMTLEGIKLLVKDIYVMISTSLMNGNLSLLHAKVLFRHLKHIVD